MRVHAPLQVESSYNGFQTRHHFSLGRVFEKDYIQTAGVIVVVGDDGTRFEITHCPTQQENHQRRIDAEDDGEY